MPQPTWLVMPQPATSPTPRKPPSYTVGYSSSVAVWSTLYHGYLVCSIVCSISLVRDWYCMHRSCWKCSFVVFFSWSWFRYFLNYGRSTCCAVCVLVANTYNAPFRGPGMKNRKKNKKMVSCIIDPLRSTREKNVSSPAHAVHLLPAHPKMSGDGTSTP